GQCGSELFWRAGRALGPAAHAMSAAKVRRSLGVEHLPGEHARLFHDLAAVFRIGVTMEVGALVDVALALGIDKKPERVVVLLELVADGEVPIGRRVDVPGNRMAA